MTNTHALRTPYGSIGNAIRSLRLKRGLTQLELAKAIKRTQSAVASYESGRICPSLMSAKRIASALNVPVEFLIGHRRSLFGNQRRPETASTDGP